MNEEKRLVGKVVKEGELRIGKKKKKKKKEEEGSLSSDGTSYDLDNQQSLSTLPHVLYYFPLRTPFLSLSIICPPSPPS